MDNWPSAQPITHELERPSFPLGALPPALADFASAVADDLQVAVDMPAVFGLGVPALIATKRVWTRVRPGWVDTPNLYLAVSGPSGDLKSVVAKKVHEPLHRWRSDIRAVAEAREPNRRLRRSGYRKHVQELERQIEALYRDELKGGCDTTELAAATAQLQTARAALAAVDTPDLPEIFTDDATPESLTRRLDEEGGRLGIVSAEANVFDQFFGLYGGRVNIDAYLKGWSGDHLQVLRGGISARNKLAGQGRADIPDPRLTIVVGTQPDAVRQVLHDPRLEERGLAQRFLITEPASRIGSRIAYVDTDTPAASTAEQAWGNYTDRLAARLSASDCNVELTLSRGAAAHFHQHWFATNEQRLAPGGELSHGGLRGFGSKMGAHIPRLATIIHLLADPDLTSTEVSEEDMLAAIELGEYFIAHRLRIVSERGLDVVTRRAQHLADWIVAQNKHTFRHTDAYDDPANRSIMEREVRNTDKPLKLLCQRGWINEIPVVRKHDGAKGGRKPARRYAVNPNVHVHAHIA